MSEARAHRRLLTTSDGAREIIEAGGRVHRDERYTGDYRYIVDYDPSTDGAQVPENEARNAEE